MMKASVTACLTVLVALLTGGGEACKSSVPQLNIVAAANKGELETVRYWLAVNIMFKDCAATGCSLNIVFFLKL